MPHRNTPTQNPIQKWQWNKRPKQPIDVKGGRSIVKKGKYIIRKVIQEGEEKKMKKRIQNEVRSGIEPGTTIASLLGDVTSQVVMDQELKSGEHSGKVKVEPVT